MMDIYDRLKQLDIDVSKAPAKGGIYSPAKSFLKKLVYVSGCGPQVDGVCEFKGKVGREVSLEQAQKMARNCAVNILAVLNREIGDLNRVGNVVKILGFVASDEHFTKQPKVLNAASQLFIDVFGEESGCAARSAIGINVLPDDIPVEIELIVELK